jgi:hypothetical protein
MTDHDHDHDLPHLPDTGDLSEVPYVDDAERAESEWLLARERDPAACAPSAKIANDYAELEDLLGDLPAGRGDDGWQDRVLRAAAAATPLPAPRRSVVRWLVGGALAAAAAVLAFRLVPGAPRAELEVAIRHDEVTRGDGDVVSVGDHMVVTARPREPADLRVYRDDGILVARCPTGPACTVSSGGDYTIDVRLAAPVPHHVVLVIGATAPLPDGTLDAYVNAARGASARIVVYPSINVR